MPDRPSAMQTRSSRQQQRALFDNAVERQDSHCVDAGDGDGGGSGGDSVRLVPPPAAVLGARESDDSSAMDDALMNIVAMTSSYTTAIGQLQNQAQLAVAALDQGPEPLKTLPERDWMSLTIKAAAADEAPHMLTILSVQEASDQPVVFQNQLSQG